MYSIDLQWKNFSVDLASVEASVKSIAADSGYAGNSADSDLTLWFTQDPASHIQAIHAYWDGIVSTSPEAVAYAQAATKLVVSTKVSAAIAFGNKMIIDFATENLLMGIDTDNQTDHVLDLMAPTMAALQSGSLNSAVRRLKSVPVASYDSKYITANRLLQNVNKIEKFMGLPLSTSLS